MPALVGSARTVQSGVPGVHSINCTHAVWMALRMGHIAPAQAQSQVVALGVDHHTRRRCHAGCAQEDQPHARMGEPEARRRCGGALRAALPRVRSAPPRRRAPSWQLCSARDKITVTITRSQHHTPQVSFPSTLQSSQSFCPDSFSTISPCIFCTRGARGRASGWFGRRGRARTGAQARRHRGLAGGGSHHQ